MMYHPHRILVAKAFIYAFALAWFLPVGASAQSTNTLPWYDSFEGYTNGTVLAGSNFMFTSGESQAFAETAAGVQDGAKQCHIPDQTVWSNSLNSGSAPVVWTDLFAKNISLRDDPPDVDSSLTAQFYFNTNRFAVVRNGLTASWVTLSNNIASASAAQINTSVWTRITVVHNYTDKKWALIVDDELLDDDIGFINTSVTKMRGMAVSNAVYLDSMLINTEYPDGTVAGLISNTNLVGDTDADAMPDYWELDYFGYASVQGGGDDFDQDGRSSASEYAMRTDPTDPNSFSNTLAFRDGFESATNGLISTNTWRGIGMVGEVSVQSSDYIEGSKALCLSTGSLNVAINDSTATNVWVQIYSKPQPYAAEPTSADIGNGQVAAFLVRTNGDLMAYSNTNWVNCDVISSVATGVWMGFAVHLDYEASRYDLYVSTNATFGQHMRRAHSTNLWFNTNALAATDLNKIIVTNKSIDVGYVDVIAASRGYTNTGVYSLTNVVAADRLVGSFKPISMPPYIYSASEDILTQQVGTDLMRELADGDKLRIYSNAQNNVYYLNSGWQWQEGIPIANMHIYKSTGMELLRLSGVDAVAFYPYSNMVSSLGDVILYGTNSPGVLNGWNQLTGVFVDYPRYPNTPLDGYLFDGSVAGDMIFKSGAKWIYYNGTKWKDGAADSVMPLTTEGFWYYHRGTGLVWRISGI